MDGALPRRSTAALALGIGALLGVPWARAADAQAPAPPEDPGEFARAMESTRRTVRETSEWLARGVDSWFGDKPFEDGGKVTDGRLAVGLLERHGERTEVSLRFNARFRLPNLQEHSYFFFGRDNEREILTDKPEALTRQQRLLRESRDDQKFFAGLGVALRESTDVRLGLRGGLKPYLQLRYTKPWTLSERERIDFRETLFWSVDDQLGSTTAVSYERALSSVLAARWLNAATITRRVGKFEWHSVLGAYRSFGSQRLLSLETSATGTQGSGVGVSDFGFRVKWEQPVHQDWVIGEFIAGHYWPRADAASERMRVWALGGGLRMRF